MTFNKNTRRLSNIPLSISLRKTLLLILIVSVTLFWFMPRFHRYAVVSELRIQGIDVKYRRKTATWLDQLLNDFRFDAISELVNVNSNSETNWSIIGKLPQLDSFCDLETYDPEEKYEFLLPVAHTVKHLQLRRIPESKEGECSFLSHFTGLESIYVNSDLDCDQIASSSPLRMILVENGTLRNLKELPHLRALVIQNSNVSKDLLPLFTFKNLEIVSFKNTNVKKCDAFLASFDGFKMFESENEVTFARANLKQNKAAMDKSKGSVKTKGSGSKNETDTVKTAFKSSE